MTANRAARAASAARRAHLSAVAPAAAPAATADYRVLAARYRADGADADRIDGAIVAIHEGLCEGTYDLNDLRSWWRQYRDGMQAATSERNRETFAAMMVGVEEAAKAFEQTQVRRGVAVPSTPAAPAPVTPAAERTDYSAVRTIPAGHYAVEIDGDLRFFKVDVGERGKWAGFRFIVRVSGDHHARMRRDEQAAALLAIAADPKSAMLRYGREIGRCGHCNRRLTDETSRAQGIGPVCAGRI